MLFVYGLCLILGVVLVYWAARFVARRFAQPKSASLIAGASTATVGALTFNADVFTCVGLIAAVCLIADIARVPPKG